ncbi:MAG: hypothetical protein J6U81_02190, partial [Bacteroidales bacterium]|nr:hypothetical protein [Bacteroidales bacterium]
ACDNGDLPRRLQPLWSLLFANACCTNDTIQTYFCQEVSKTKKMINCPKNVIEKDTRTNK